MRVYPHDPPYAALVRGFNLRWVGSPKYVEVCSSPEEVAGAIDSARGAGLRITFRGGGHCYENFVSGNDGGVILDLSPMCDVSRDAEGLVCVEGGATLWNVYTRLAREHGLVLPAGSCYSVGAGGHVPAGGYGLLSRLHGLTVDYLEGVEMVCCDRERGAVITRRFGAGDELVWACRGGGGGNFGVITKFFFKDLPAAPAWATIMTAAWDWDSFDEASFAKFMSAYGDFCVAHAGADDPYLGLFPLLHLNAKTSTSQITLTAQNVGTEREPLRDLLATLTAAMKPVAASCQTLPWLFATQTLDGSGPNRRGKYKSAYMIKSFPDAQIEAIWNALQTPPPGSQALLQIDGYGGRVNAVPVDATAVAQRSSAMKLQFQIYWYHEKSDGENEPGDKECLDWIRRFYGAMYGPAGPVPDGVMDGCYVGYPDADLQGWQRLYYKGHYEGLQRAKQRVDPLDVFNHAQSIELTASST